MSRKKLAMIDDDTSMGTFVRNVAEGIGFDVDTQTDPEKFLKAVASGQPDVVILDLTMPRMDGVELLRALADQGCRSAIYIMSGYQANIVSMAFEIGQVADLDMRAVIHKPVRAAELREVLYTA